MLYCICCIIIKEIKGNVVIKKVNYYRFMDFNKIL